MQQKKEIRMFVLFWPKKLFIPGNVSFYLKIVINLPKTKEKHISSAVSEILRYSQTHTKILLLLYKDNYKNKILNFFFY